MSHIPSPATTGKPGAGTGIKSECDRLASLKTRGDLGRAIAALVLAYSPRDLQQMKGSFSEKIQDINPEYRKRLEETTTEYLHGTYQNVRLMNQQGAFGAMHEAVADAAPAYWTMVSQQCPTGTDEADRLRFLKFLLAGFCMFVQGLPGHPAGMPFPGGDRVEIIDGISYCPVRTKANDVDAALCPFCPALQTPVDRLSQTAGECERAPETGVHPELLRLP